MKKIQRIDLRLTAPKSSAQLRYSSKPYAKMFVIGGKVDSNQTHKAVSIGVRPWTSLNEDLRHLLVFKLTSLLFSRDDSLNYHYILALPSFAVDRGLTDQWSRSISNVYPNSDPI